MRPSRSTRTSRARPASSTPVESTTPPRPNAGSGAPSASSRITSTARRGPRAPAGEHEPALGLQRHRVSRAPAGPVTTTPPSPKFSSRCPPGAAAAPQARTSGDRERAGQEDAPVAEQRDRARAAGARPAQVDGQAAAAAEAAVERPRAVKRATTNAEPVAPRRPRAPRTGGERCRPGSPGRARAARRRRGRSRLGRPAARPRVARRARARRRPERASRCAPCPPTPPGGQSRGSACQRAGDVGGDLRDLGRRAPDAHALCLERLCFAAAVPSEPDTIAPAWPIVLPGGAVKPAM